MSVTCVKNPTRAGWWLVWLKQSNRPETLEVFERDGEMLVYFGELFRIDDIRDEFGGWIGPIEFDQEQPLQKESNASHDS